MTDTNMRGWEGIFDGQKVPIDFRAILLAGLGCALFQIGLMISGYFALPVAIPSSEGLENAEASVVVSVSVFNGAHEICSRFFTGFFRMFAGMQYYGYHPEIQLLEWYWYFGILFYLFLLWIFFSAMINRIIVVKIAKEDVTDIPTAFQFAWNNKLAYLFTPLVSFGAILFFCFCNWMAGVAGSIPLVGPFLYVGLYFLVILSTCIIFLIGIGAIFGFNLISSAISAEGSDGLEAFMSVYNYIYTRPWHLVFYYFLTLLFSALLYILGHFFVDFTLNSSGVRTDTQQIEYCAASEGGKLLKSLLSEEEEKKLEEVLNATTKEEGSKKELEQPLIIKTVLEPFKFTSELDPKTNKKVWKQEIAHEYYFTAEPPEYLRQFPKMSQITVYQQGLETIGEYVHGATLVKVPEMNERKEDPNFGKVEYKTRTMSWTDIKSFPLRFAAICLLMITTVLQYFFLGWVVAYFLSASTLIYFLLRKEVDGTEYEEIYEEEEEDILEPLSPASKSEASQGHSHDHGHGHSHSHDHGHEHSTPASDGQVVSSNVIVTIPDHLKKDHKKENESASASTGTEPQKEKQEMPSVSEPVPIEKKEEPEKPSVSEPVQTEKKEEMPSQGEASREEPAKKDEVSAKVEPPSSSESDSLQKKEEE
jgi:hypothetical protein